MDNEVLVPFDVGVVYINLYAYADKYLSFSPLRCWGGLYPIQFFLVDFIKSFSPLRYWGGLYQDTVPIGVLLKF